MPIGLAEYPTVAKKRGRPTTGRDDAPVKLAKHLAKMAKSIAETRGVPLGQYLSEITEQPISRDYAKMLRELDAKGKTE